MDVDIRRDIDYDKEAEKCLPNKMGGPKKDYISGFNQCRNECKIVVRELLKERDLYKSHRKYFADGHKEKNDRIRELEKKLNSHWFYSQYEERIKELL